jgi:hypothetical protein
VLLLQFKNLATAGLIRQSGAMAIGSSSLMLDESI